MNISKLIEIEFIEYVFVFAMHIPFEYYVKMQFSPVVNLRLCW